MKLEIGKYYIIRWLDHYSHTNADSTAPDYGQPEIQVSIGKLNRLTKTMLVLETTWSEGSKIQLNDIMAIIRREIVSVEEVVPKGGRNAKRKERAK